MFSIFLPTLAMTAVLTMASLAIFGVAVFAPEAAAALGIPATLVGVFTGVVYCCGALSGMVTATWNAHLGPVRVSQLALLLVAAGMGLMSLGHPMAALGCAVLVGIAYGTLNPASAVVLAQAATPRWRSLAFSLKQTGVPWGGMLAGLLVPPLVLYGGWQLAAATIAVLALLVMVAVQPLRVHFDQHRPPPGQRGARDSITLIRHHHALRGLAMVGLAYGGTQVSVGSFFVVYLVEQLQQPLVQAGIAFMAVQAGGIIGRPAWGLLATVLSPGWLLSALGFGAAIAVAVLLMLSGDTHLGWQMVLGFLLGMASFGWNGVFLAEVAHHAPEGRIGEATGGVQIFMFSGVVVLPPIFGGLVSLSGSYIPAFAVLMVVYTVAGIYLGRQAWREG